MYSPSVPGSVADAGMWVYTPQSLGPQGANVLDPKHLHILSHFNPHRNSIGGGHPILILISQMSQLRSGEVKKCAQVSEASKS